MAAISSLQIGGVTYDIYSTSAKSAGSATNAATAIYANSAGAAPFISHDHGYKISAGTTAFNVSSNIQLSAGTNVGLVSAGTNSIGITAKDTTYSTLNTINSNEFKALTGVSGVKDIKNYSTISAASGSTSKGSFAPSNSASTFTFIAGNNIDLVSGANSLTISSKSYTVNDKTIKITTGANPATGQFSTNTAADKTITLGSMALKASGDYSTTSHNHNMTALNGTANFFSGTTAAPSALSALTSKSAISAGSAQKSYSSYWSKAGDDADTDRIIGLGVLAGTSYWTAGSEFYGTVTYDTAFTFNSKSNTMKVINVSATSVTGVTTSGTTIKGVTISGTNITAATTVRGTNLSGTNISGASKTATIDNLITSASRAIPTVNNKTITITTGASPATASFSTNTADNKTITLGSMALKASGDYIPNSYSSSTASTFSGKAVSAVNAANLYVAENSTNNTTYYPIWANGVGNFVRGIYTTTAKLQFNPGAGQLYISNIVKVGSCSMTWNASTSALDFNF